MKDNYLQAPLLDWHGPLWVAPCSILSLGPESCIHLDAIQERHPCSNHLRVSKIKCCFFKKTHQKKHKETTKNNQTNRNRLLFPGKKHVTFPFQFLPPQKIPKPTFPSEGLELSSYLLRKRPPCHVLDVATRQRQA